MRSGKGLIAIRGKCIPYAIFGNNTQALADLPASISKMGIDPSPVTDAYKIANGIMHATGTSYLTALCMHPRTQAVMFLR